jgi:hypothetical protein
VRRSPGGTNLDSLNVEDVEHAEMSTDDLMIDTPDGPMTFAEWKKKHPVQVPSRRTKGKDLPVKVKRFTDK